MADLLNTSISGLLAFQRALDTTGHNIANAQTVGYSRQLPQFTTRTPQQFGSLWLGSGVDVSSVHRAYDNFLAAQSRSSSSAASQAGTFATQAARISNLFGDGEAGITASLQSLVNALQSVADTPASIPARQGLLSQSQALVEQLRATDASLRSLDAQMNAGIASEADSITALAQGIAQLNGQIASAQARSGQPPNDLLDQCDRLLDELATHINVEVVPQGDATVNVFIGNGQPLVLGQQASRLVAIGDGFDPARQRVAVASAVGTMDITASLGGGTLGGMLEFRQQMLDPARNALGRISAGLTQVMNEQHRAGMDLRGNIGGEFFAIGPPDVRAHEMNGGDARILASLGDSAGLTGSDYVLAYGGGTWTLRRQDTGVVVPMTGSGTAADPWQADGLSIVHDGGVPADADRILIRPLSDAVVGLALRVTDPAQVAAAMPVIANASADNQGSAMVSGLRVLDASNPALRSETTLTFISAGQYQISGDPTVHTFTPGQPIAVNGWRLDLQGTPAAGDSFTVRDNSNGVGDNRNALAMADILGRPVLDGGSTSLQSAVGQMVGRIGVQTRQAQVTHEAQQLVARENANALDSVAGVNLDEEAANMMRYQQAYMAMAQLVRVADTLFQSVLDATRR